MPSRPKLPLKRDEIEVRLEQIPLFAVLAADERAALAEKLMPRRMVKSQPVFLQGDPGDEMYLLLEGRIRICCESLTGREITLAILRDGGFFGEMALLDGEPRSATAVAESAGQLLVLRRTDFQTFLQATPNAGISLLAFLSQRLRKSNDKVQDLALLTVRERLAALLLDLATKEGEPRDNAPGVMLPKGVTHKTLSGLLGTSRETVTRMCAELKELGYIEQHGRRMAVVNLEGLAEVLAAAEIR